MFDELLVRQAAALVAAYRARSWILTAAESCTGGLLSALLTDIAGASDVFERGFVTYSNRAKMELLDVPEALLVAHGAVSEETARAMAEGALRRARADIAASITGIAGPGGGSAAKPVGLVHVACARMGYATLHAYHVFAGDRQDIRMAAVAAALGLLSDQAALLP